MLYLYLYFLYSSIKRSNDNLTPKYLFSFKFLFYRKRSFNIHFGENHLSSNSRGYKKFTITHDPTFVHCTISITLEPEDRESTETYVFNQYTIIKFINRSKIKELKHIFKELKFNTPVKRTTFSDVRIKIILEFPFPLLSHPFLKSMIISI